MNMGVGMSSYAKNPKPAVKRFATIAVAAAILSGCSAGSMLDTVSGAAGLVGFGADLAVVGGAFKYAGAGEVLDFEGMQDGMEMIIIAGEVGDVAGETEDAADAVAPLVDYLTEE